MRLNKEILKKWLIPVVVLFFACLIILGSSPIYKTNPWTDSNAMLTMGRSMLHGIVPYKDIIDQRGPVLYLIFVIGAMFSRTSFFGVFLLQIINIGIIYFLSWRIANDFKIRLVRPEWAALLGPIALFCTSSMMFSGAPEEFAFTSILYLLYVVNHYHQQVLKIPLKTYFWLGLNLSLVFWSKYSMIGAFVAFFIWVACLLVYQKSYQQLWKIIKASVLGFLIITILVLLYFIIKGAMRDLFDIYFVQNFVSYGSSKQGGLMKFLNLFSLVGQEFHRHYIVAILTLLGWMKEIYEKKSVTLEAVMFLVTIIFVAMQHWINEYYNLIWMPFLAIALLRLVDFRMPHQNLNQKLFYPVKIILVGFLLFLPFMNNLNLGQLVLNGEKTSFNGGKYSAQPKFAKIMHQESKQPSLLMVNDLDEGFYLAADILPTTNYWQRLNMTYTQLPRMYWSFEKNMREKKVEFVIVRLIGAPAPDKKGLYDQVANSVDKSVYPTLTDNYKVKSIVQNDPNNSFILFQLKNMH